MYYAMVWYSTFIAIKRDIVVKTGFITLEPLFKAIFVPSLAPIIIAKDTGMASL